MQLACGGLLDYSVLHCIPTESQDGFERIQGVFNRIILRTTHLSFLQNKNLLLKEERKKYGERKEKGNDKK